MAFSTRKAFLLVFVVTFLWAGWAQAQSQPKKHKVAPQTADQVSDVHTADLDGDGDQDVLSASFRDDKIAWYENRGGSFPDQKIITTSADGARSIYATDIDGDSDLDVLTASSSGVAWYENTSSGFSTRKIINTSTYGANSVYAADIDGDSDPDVLSAHHTEDKIAWYENTSNGFSDQKTITTNASGAISVYAADLDGDSDPDVLTALSDGNTIAWYENTSSGFSSQKTITTSVESPQSVYAADIDGDSDPDVLSASFTDDKIAWYENTSSGFSSQKTITTNANGAFSVYAADLDGDSDPDVLSTSLEDNNISVYENKISGGGGFGAGLQVTTQVDRPEDVHAADLDGDSNPDLLSASASDNKIARYENQLSENGGFGAQQVIVPRPTVDGITSVHATDLDGDEDKDILSASSDDNKVAWYENTSSGFSNQKIIATSANGARSVYTADIDGDSDPDVLSSSSDNIAWYENTSSGFSNKKMIDADDSQSVYATDLDGDSDPDIISAGGNKVVWYENTSSGFSSQKTITTNVVRALSVYAADLDGDSDPDVLYASSGKIAWHENQVGESGADGDGFGVQTVITTNADGAQSVYAADLDGDTDPDVLSASFSDDKVAWYENTSGGFSSQNVITTSAREAKSVYAADLNGDSDPDVLSVGTRGSVVWYEQTTSFGSTSFASAKTIDVESGRVVYASDLTGNESPDIVAGITSSGVREQLVWYENTSSVLPVELASIEATRSRGSVVLTWKTTSEQNNAGFEVQRRASNGWTTLSFIKGAGTTSEVQTYRHRDTDLPYEAGSVTYRLKQVDIDGTTEVSETRTLKIGDPDELSLQAPFPNPAQGQVTLRYALPRKTDVSIQIYDVLGRQVATLQRGAEDAGRREIQISTSDLSSGTYFVRMQAGEKLKTKRLTVVK